ncbi:MAG: hypothetical protein IJN37_07345 [Clostridia bacterium]|nr:hypothetical protein [Clostridia bacterium]
MRIQIDPVAVLSLFVFILMFMVIFLMSRFIKGLVFEKTFRLFHIVIAVMLLTAMFFAMELTHSLANSFAYTGKEEPTTAAPTAATQTID